MRGVRYIGARYFCKHRTIFIVEHYTDLPDILTIYFPTHHGFLFHKKYTTDNDSLIMHSIYEVVYYVPVDKYQYAHNIIAFF